MTRVEWLAIATRGVVAVLVAVSLVMLLGIARQNRANGDLIVDCTTPGGECYQRSQARTADVVRRINEATVAAISCSRREYSDDAIKACVARKVEAR